MKKYILTLPPGESWIQVTDDYMLEQGWARKEELNDLNEECQSLQMRIDDLEDEVYGLEGDLSSAQDSIDTLEEQLSYAEQQLQLNAE